MNNIQLNIVANAQFQQVYAEVAKLKEAMLSLQKASVGGPFTPQVTASIKQAQSAFDSAVLSTRAFTIEHVAMSSSVEKFGKQLKSGQLSLSNYYKIWRDSAKGVSSELDALATSQARLNRSIAIADPLRPGFAKLVTDINGVVTAQEKALFYQKALNTALQQGSIKLIDFGKNTQWMGRQLTVGLTMPLAMFGASVSQSFLQVDKELTRMQKVYGEGLIQPTQAALKQIRSDVMLLGRDLAKTLGASVKDTAAMAADLAATGLQGAELLSSTKEAMRLATLGELDHQQAMAATVSLQNVYRLSTEGLTEAVNFLNAVENQTSTSLQDLVDAIPRVGPIVMQLGGSFKDTAAMMVAMKEAGVPAAQGANAIKSALSSLINPSTNAKKAFQDFNINLANIASSTGGKPMLMLKALSQEMGKLDRLAQAQLIEKLFGKYQFARVQALIDNINKVGSQTQTVFNLMGASSEDLSKLATNELKAQTESASGRFKRMVETLKADLLPIGDMFLNSFTRIGNVIDKVINAVRGLANVFGPVAKMLGGLFGGGIAGLVVVGPLIMMVGLFANLIGNLLRGANALRMFRQGMQSAAATENRFLAGLHGMRNFYEELDKSTIAARNQMDLMPEAITSNATAFNILRKSIFELTEQFTALAAAQRAAMGVPTTSAAGNPFNIPFRAPGHISGVIGISGGTPGKDSIPAMLAPGESVMTAAATAKFGPILGAMNASSIPGFMTGIIDIGNGVTRNVNMHKSTHIDELNRLLADPELPYAAKLSVLDFIDQAGPNNIRLSDIAQYVAEQKIAGYRGTGLSKVGASSSGRSRPSSVGTVAGQLLSERPGNVSNYELEAARRSGLAIQESLRSSGASQGRIDQATQISAAHTVFGIDKDAALRNNALGRASWSTGITVPQSQEENQFTEIVKTDANKTAFLKGHQEALKKELELARISGKTQEELRALENEYLVLQQKIANGQALTNKELITQGKIADETLTYLKTAEGAELKISTSFETYLNSMKAGGQARAQYLAELRAQGVTEEEIAQIGKRNLELQIQTLETAKAAALEAGMHNVADIYDSLIQGMREGLLIESPSRAAEQIGLETAAGLKQGLTSASSGAVQAGQSLAQAEIAGVAKEIPAASAVGVALGAAEVGGAAAGGGLGGLFGGDLEGGSQPGRLTTWGNKYSFASKAGKGGIAGKIGSMFNLGSLLKGGAGMKFGLGAMMAPMAINMLPNKIGGTNLSGAKNVLGTTASVAGMASFIPGLAAFLPEIIAASVAVGGIKLAFQAADKAKKKFEEGVRKTYAELEKTPDKFTEKIGQEITLADTQAKKYKNLSIQGKIYGDTMVKAIDGISKGTFKGKELDNALSLLNNGISNSAAQFNFLKLAAEKAGNTKLTGLIKEIEKAGLAGISATRALITLSQMQGAGLDPTQFIGTYGVKGTTDKKAISAFYDAEISKAKAELYALQHPSTPGGAGTDAAIKALKKKIDHEETIKKNLDDQLKTMQKQADTINKQNDYLNKQTDLTQQIKQAEISGNYLQAAQLRNVQGQQTAQFRQQQAIDAQQGRVDAQQALIDQLNAQLQKLQDIASAAQATALNTAGIKAAQDKINSLLASKDKVLGGLKAAGTDGDPVVVRPTLVSAANRQKTADYLGPGAAAYAVDQVSTSDLEKAGAKRTGGDRWNPGTYSGQIITWKGKKYKVGSQMPYSGNWSITPVQKASGGPISGPGTWTSDSIPAMLSSGEFVMNAGSVNKYGLGMMYALNNKSFNVPGQSGFSGMGGGTTAQNINFYINGVNDPKAVADMVMQKLQTVNAKINKTNAVIK